MEVTILQATTAYGVSYFILIRRTPKYALSRFP